MCGTRAPLPVQAQLWHAGLIHQVGTAAIDSGSARRCDANRWTAQCRHPGDVVRQRVLRLVFPLDGRCAAQAQQPRRMHSGFDQDGRIGTGQLVRPRR